MDSSVHVVLQVPYSQSVRLCVVCLGKEIEVYIFPGIIRFILF